jgi:hypothetical protein
MIKRVYYLNGVETTLDVVLEYITHLLETNGDTSVWADLGIDFEDYYEDENLMV